MHAVVSWHGARSGNSKACACARHTTVHCNAICHSTSSGPLRLPAAAHRPYLRINDVLRGTNTIRAITSSAPHATLHARVRHGLVTQDAPRCSRQSKDTSARPSPHLSLSNTETEKDGGS